jgi:hypothetical protein
VASLKVRMQRLFVLRHPFLLLNEHPEDFLFRRRESTAWRAFEQRREIKRRRNHAAHARRSPRPVEHALACEMPRAISSC